MGRANPCYLSESLSCDAKLLERLIEMLVHPIQPKANIIIQLVANYIDSLSAKSEIILIHHSAMQTIRAKDSWNSVETESPEVLLTQTQEV